MTRDIYASRLNDLKNDLEENKIDVGMIMSPTNVYYFTGFHSNPHERFMALLVDNRKDHVALFVPALDVNAAEQHARIEQIIPVSETENPYVKLQQTIGTGVTSFGIEKNDVSVYRYEQIAERFPDATFVNVEAFIMSKRLKKTRDEIAIVQRAVNIVEQVMDKGINQVVLGMTELELKADLEYQMMVLGADGPAFDTTVLFGEKSALPHGHPGQRKLMNGDFLMIDMGVTVDGYCSDITRTFVAGEGSAKHTDIYETVLEANEKAINAVKAGEPLMHIDRAAREHIEARHYGEYFNHRVGHGLGLDIHEPPSIHGENTQTLEPGLLFTIEPGIYIPGFGGVRIEDNIYVNENGHVEVLTSYPKALTVI